MEKVLAVRSYLVYLVCESKGFLVAGNWWLGNKSARFFPQTKPLLWARTDDGNSTLCSVEREVLAEAKYGVEKGGDAPED